MPIYIQGLDGTPVKVGAVTDIGYNEGIKSENDRWTTLVNSATATAEDVAKGKTFVDDYGEIKDGTLDVETLKEAGISEMWDYIQAFGVRTDYSNFGAVIWTKKNFKPNYNLNVTDCYRMFSYPSEKLEELLISDGRIVMKELETERSIVFDFSKCKNFSFTFAVSPFSELNVIDVSNATSLAYAFYGGYWTYSLRDMLGLRRIERLICSENTTFDNTSFQYSSAFTYIGFEGVIAKNGLNVSWSTKLDKESHVKLVNTLSSTTSGLSVTVSQTAVNKAFETSEGANDGSTSQEWLNLIATKNNWTISLG